MYVAMVLHLFLFPEPIKWFGLSAADWLMNLSQPSDAINYIMLPWLDFIFSYIVLFLEALHLINLYFVSLTKIHTIGHPYMANIGFLSILDSPHKRNLC